MNFGGLAGFGNDSSSSSSPSATQGQHHDFSQDQFLGPHQYVMTPDAQRHMQVGSSPAMPANSNPLAPQANFFGSQGGGFGQNPMASDMNGSAHMGDSFALALSAYQHTQFDNESLDAKMGNIHASSQGDSMDVVQEPTPKDTPDATDTSTPLLSQDNSYSEAYRHDPSSASSGIRIKREHSDDDYVPGDIAVDDDVEELTSEQPGKKRKVNKNGRVRKIREPRGHLRRWDESDVSRALVGIVWACGENGVVIPFAQAAKLVDQDCTSGALQQAILKLHDKMNKDGAQLPKIKMNWPKKPSSGGNAVIRDNGKVPRKKPTLAQATQCNIVSFSTHLPGPTMAPAAAVMKGLPSSRNIAHLAPSTPLQRRASPVCPPAPKRPIGPRPAMADASTGAATFNGQPLAGDNRALPRSSGQRSSGVGLPSRLGSPTNKGIGAIPQGSAQLTRQVPDGAHDIDFNGPTISGGFRSQAASSSMYLDAARSRNATPSNALTTFRSPMLGAHGAGSSSQNVKKALAMLPSSTVGGFLQPSSSSSPMDDLSLGIHSGLADSRRDSAHDFGSRSASSSQGSNGPMSRSVRESQQAFQDKLRLAATERSMTPMPSRAMRAYQSLQQPRQQLSIGLDTLENPFGGSYGDASDDFLSSMNPSSGSMAGQFSFPSTTDTDMDLNEP